MTTRDELETLAALYAAGALDAQEAADVEARIEAGDSALEAAVRAHDRTVEALMDDVAPRMPDPRIKASLLARVALTPSDSDGIQEQRAADADWQPVVIDGITWEGVAARVLHVDEAAGRITTLLKLDPGGEIPEHVHHQDEECFVVSGDLRFGESSYAAGDYFRAPAGSLHERQWTETGCTCLVTTSLTNKYT